MQASILKSTRLLSKRYVQSPSKLPRDNEYALRYINIHQFTSIYITILCIPPYFPHTSPCFGASSPSLLDRNDRPFRRCGTAAAVLREAPGEIDGIFMEFHCHDGICIHIYIYVGICMCVFVYTYIYICTCRCRCMEFQ